MKLFVGWALSACVIVTASAAGAQVLPPYQIGSSYSKVSDFGGPDIGRSGPYAAMPPDAMPPRYAPAVLPPHEVYRILRENGFSPLGAPQQRGLVYTISAIDLGSGEDGRLVIDVRNGRIVRFLPASRWGDRMSDEVTAAYGSPGPLPPMSDMRRVPRPPASVPRVASRTPTGVPLPKAMPPRAVGGSKPAAPLAATPAPAAAPVQQSAAVQPKPADDAPAAPPAAAPAPAESKPSTQIMPTQDMPKVQGLD